MLVNEFMPFCFPQRVLPSIFLTATLAGLSTAALSEHSADHTTEFSDFFVNISVPAVPNAEEIIVDLPNVFHTSRYQKGTIGPWTFVIYPDGSAKVLSTTERLLKAATLHCIAGDICNISIVNGANFDVFVERGALPNIPSSTDIRPVTEYIARWILAGTAPEIIPNETTDPDVNSTINVNLENAPEQLVQISDNSIADTPTQDNSSLAPETQTPSALQAEIVEAEPAPLNDEPTCAEEDPVFPSLCSGTPSAPQALPPSPQLDRVATVRAPQTVPPAPPEMDDQASDYAERVVGWSWSDINCALTASTNLALIDGGDAKPRISLGCGTQITDRLSLRGAVIGYAIPNHQQVWDPDYTYALTYKVNDQVSLSYSNYAARFSDSQNPVDDLFNGTFRATFKLPEIALPNDQSLPCSASIGLPDPTDASLNLSCSYSVTPRFRLLLM